MIRHWLLLLIATYPMVATAQPHEPKCLFPDTRTLALIRGPELRKTIVGRRFDALGLSTWSFGQNGRFQIIGHGPSDMEGGYKVSYDRICIRGLGARCFRFFRSSSGDLIVMTLAPRDGHCHTIPWRSLTTESWVASLNSQTAATNVPRSK